ncbi:hypothetical protein AN1V17_42050 [Vallitalea sediminicola]
MNQKDKEEDKVIKCENCNKTLAKGHIIKGRITIKCKKCKHYTTIGN